MFFECTLLEIVIGVLIISFLTTALILPKIKSLGEFKVEINLHSDVQTQITVKVVPQEEIK